MTNSHFSLSSTHMTDHTGSRDCKISPPSTEYQNAARHAVTLHPQLQTALEVAFHAGEMVRAGWQRSTETWTKAPGDTCTEVDLAVDAYMVRALGLASRDTRIVCEESWDGAPVDTRPTWVVDPLDATTAFRRTNNPSFPAVMLAYVEGGEVQCSVVYFPLTAELFYSAKGKGAWKDGVHVQWDPAVPVTWLRMNRYGDAALESSFVERLQEAGRKAGGVDLVSVEPPSAGMACRLTPGSALVHDNNALKIKQGPWDIAAPSLWVAEAGGVMVTARGAPVPLNCSEPFVVATSPAAAQRVLDLANSRPTALQPVRYRIAEPREGPALAMFVLSHGKNEWNYLPEEELVNHGRAIANGLCHAVVAELYGKVVGVATYELGDCFLDLDPKQQDKEQRAYVAEVTVAEQVRGQGVGSTLLTRLLSKLSGEGVSVVYAKRHAQNAGSAGMMRKAGFTPLATFPDPKIRETGNRQTTVERYLCIAKQ